MSELGDVFREWKKQKQLKRQSNLIKSTKMLEDCKVHFISRNNGVHLIILHNEEHIDFWPSTGLWISKTYNIRNRGIRKLLKHLKVTI